LRILLPPSAQLNLLFYRYFYRPTPNASKDISGVAYMEKPGALTSGLLRWSGSRGSNLKQVFWGSAHRQSSREALQLKNTADKVTITYI
jgi:hypothetical protein